MNAELSRSAAQMFLEREGSPVYNSPVRGHVERLDPVMGLQGWVAGATPDQAPELELRIDGVVVAKCLAISHRPDIWLPSDASVLSGFLFAIDELVALTARSDFGPYAVVQVGPSGCSEYLTAASAWTFSDLQLLIVSDVQPDIEVGIGLALPAELRRLAMLARRAFSQPARQDPRKRLGVVEFTAALPGHGFIVGGWMEASAPRATAVVLVAEGRRFAGGFICVMRSRPDLSIGAQAFVGILLLDDKLEFQRAPQWSLHMAGASGCWLSSVHPLRILDEKAAFVELQQAISASSDLRGKEIEQYVRDTLPWGTLEFSTQRDSVRVGLDDCVVAPGFGIFFRGWVLSPVGVLVDLTARFGDAVFHLDPASLTIGGRHDLGVSFPDYGDRLDSASVTALLRGAEKPDPQGKWLLRLRFDNGLVHMHELSVAHTRRIDLSYDLSRLQIIYPGFDSATWLPELVDSLYGPRAIQERASVHWDQPLTCKSALVLAISPKRSHQGISLDNFERHLRRLPPSTGAVIVVPASMPAGILSNWMALIRARHPKAPIGACRLGAGSHHWAALWTVLEQCGIQHFVYVGPSVLLTDAGADESARLLSSPCEGAVFLAVEKIRSGNTELAYETSAFSWTSAELCAHTANAVALIDYAWRDNAIIGGFNLPAAIGKSHALHIGAHTTPLIESINQRMVAQQMSASTPIRSQIGAAFSASPRKKPILIKGVAS